MLNKKLKKNSKNSKKCKIKSKKIKSHYIKKLSCKRKKKNRIGKKMKGGSSDTPTNLSFKSRLYFVYLPSLYYFYLKKLNEGLEVIESGLPVELLLEFQFVAKQLKMNKAFRKLKQFIDKKKSYDISTKTGSIKGTFKRTSTRKKSNKIGKISKKYGSLAVLGAIFLASFPRVTAYAIKKKLEKDLVTVKEIFQSLVFEERILTRIGIFDEKRNLTHSLDVGDHQFQFHTDPPREELFVGEMLKLMGIDPEQITKIMNMLKIRKTETPSKYKNVNYSFVISIGEEKRIITVEFVLSEDKPKILVSIEDNNDVEYDWMEFKHFADDEHKNFDSESLLKTYQRGGSTTREITNDEIKSSVPFCLGIIVCLVDWLGDDLVGYVILNFDPVVETDPVNLLECVGNFYKIYNDLDNESEEINLNNLINNSKPVDLGPLAEKFIVRKNQGSSHFIFPANFTDDYTYIGGHNIFVDGFLGTSITYGPLLEYILHIKDTNKDKSEKTKYVLFLEIDYITNGNISYVCHNSEGGAALNFDIIKIKDEVMSF